MADPLIRFIEQLLIVDEALTPEEDTGVFVESLLRVRQALIDHEDATPIPGLPNWNTQHANQEDKTVTPIDLKRCESDEDVPIPTKWT